MLSPEKHVSWVKGICIIHRNPLTFLTVSIQMSASCNCFLPLKKCPLLLVFTRFSEDFGNAGRFRLFNLQSFQIEFLPLILGNRYNLVHVGLVWLLKTSQRIQITSNILFYYRKAWKNLTKLRKPYIRVFRVSQNLWKTSLICVSLFAILKFPIANNIRYNFCI